MPDLNTDELQLRLASVSEALRRAEERALAGQFAVEVMHEVRNPLEALGYLIYLAEQEDDVAEIRVLLRSANEQIATVNRIASQTLGFVKATSLCQEINLASLAEAALRIHHRRIEANKIHLVRNFEDHVTAEVYSNEILQVLSNLLGNALDALPEGGTISLRLRNRGTYIQMVIADNGNGIDATQIGRLFEPFFTTKENRGTGLGLTLSRKIIERHRGNICVRSSTSRQRCGTTFRITLPALMAS